MAINIKGNKKRWNGMDLFFVLIIAAVAVAVVFLLGFGEVAVRYKAGVELLFVISGFAVGPAVVHTSLRPYFMCIFRELFAEFKNIFAEDYIVCVYG